MRIILAVKLWFSIASFSGWGSALLWRQLQSDNNLAIKPRTETRHHRRGRESLPLCLLIKLACHLIVLLASWPSIKGVGPLPSSLSFFIFCSFWCIANCHNGRDGAGQAGNYELRVKRNHSARLRHQARPSQTRPDQAGPIKKRNEQPGDAHKVSAENGGHKISRGQESAFACGQQKWRWACSGWRG